MSKDRDFLTEDCPKPQFKIGQVVWAGGKLRKIIKWGGYCNPRKGKSSTWIIGYTLDGDVGQGLTWWEPALKPLSDREKGSTQRRVR